MNKTNDNDKTMMTKGMKPVGGDKPEFIGQTSITEMETPEFIGQTSISEIPAIVKKSPGAKNNSANSKKSPNLSTAQTIPPVSGDINDESNQTAISKISKKQNIQKKSSSGGKKSQRGEQCTRRELGPYEIIAFLGKGGMGTVYKGVDRSLQRTVAIKELSPEIAKQAELVQRFLREARLVAKLNHPNICDIYYL